jgi:hypothetical protein
MAAYFVVNDTTLFSEPELHHSMGRHRRLVVVCAGQTGFTRLDVDRSPTPISTATEPGGRRFESCGRRLWARRQAV